MKRASYRPSNAHTTTKNKLEKTIRVFHTWEWLLLFNCHGNILGSTLASVSTVATFAVCDPWTAADRLKTSAKYCKRRWGISDIIAYRTTKPVYDIVSWLMCRVHVSTSTTWPWYWMTRLTQSINQSIILLFAQWNITIFQPTEVCSDNVYTSKACQPCQSTYDCLRTNPKWQNNLHRRAHSYKHLHL